MTSFITGLSELLFKRQDRQREKDPSQSLFLPPTIFDAQLWLHIYYALKTKLLHHAKNNFTWAFSTLRT